MTAIAIVEPGGPEVLVAETRPLPRLGPHDMLVSVAAAGVNRPDILQRTGNYAPPAGAPDIPGLEVAGHVVARGDKARRFAIADKVCALVPGGGYAEFCAVHEDNTLPAPQGLSLIESAAVPETFFTVWANVFERGGLRERETLLVHGGTSGIGTTAIMLAAAFGARVIATAGTDEKCAACLALGAGIAINHRRQDFVAEVKLATDGRGADVVLDMVGGPYVDRNLDAAALDGRIVQIAFLQGAKATIDLGKIMMKRLTLTGSTLRPRSVAEKASIAGALRERVWPLLAQGRCKPLVDSTFPLVQAAQAHRRMESGEHIGKIVLVTGR
jgi:NADPH2:quinone reductase